MKNILLFAFVAMIFFGYNSCKDAVDDAIDCSVESAFLSLKYEVDTANPLLVDFAFINADTVNNRFTLQPAINWEFGDGSEETTDNFTATHIYADTGRYEVKAHYLLKKGSSSCSGYKSKNITLE